MQLGTRTITIRPPQMLKHARKRTRTRCCAGPPHRQRVRRLNQIINNIVGERRVYACVFCVGSSEHPAAAESAERARESVARTERTARKRAELFRRSAQHTWGNIFGAIACESRTFPPWPGLKHCTVWHIAIVPVILDRHRPQPRCTTSCKT